MISANVSCTASDAGAAAGPDGRGEIYLTPVLWKYLYRYAKKHQARGTASVMEWSILTIRKASRVRFCALLQRWRGNFNRSRLGYGTGEKDFDDPLNQQHRPRRLTLGNARA